MSIIRFLLILLILATPIVGCGKNVEIAFLNNRFSFIFPAGSICHNGSEEVESNELITTVFYKKGKKNYTFIARDLNLLYTEDLPEQLKTKSFSISPLNFFVLYNKDSAKVMLMANQKNYKLNGIYSAIIKNADNTLSRISIHLNPKATRDKEGSELLIRKVLKSFKRGPGCINMDERIERFEVFRSNIILSFPIPKGYVINRTRKQDKFEKYIITRLVAFGSVQAPSLVLNLTDSVPELQLGHSFVRSPDTYSTIMTNSVTWLNFFDKERRVFIRQQKLFNNEIKNNMVLDIQMFAGSPPEIEALTAIITKIKMKPAE